MRTVGDCKRRNKLTATVYRDFRNDSFAVGHDKLATCIAAHFHCNGLSTAKCKVFETDHCAVTNVGDILVAVILSVAAALSKVRGLPAGIFAV